MYGADSPHHQLEGLFRRLPFTVQNVLARQLTPNDRVLDVGCGPSSPLRFRKVKRSVGIEICEPYVREAQQRRTHDEIIAIDCLQAHFSPDSFDVVVALDVIEHLTKEGRSELIKRMQRWASKKVIISVPNGYSPGHPVDANPFQEHRACWSPAELTERGFRLRGIGVKLPGYGSTGLLFYVVRYGTYPLRFLTYYYPRLAYDIVGIYDKPLVH